MNPFQRLGRYVSVWTNFHQIRSLNLESHSLEEIVDQVFEYSGGFFRPIQVRSEILDALREVKQLRPKYIVEVGTARGGTLLLWSRVADPEATIITIDLPGGDYRGGAALRQPLFRRLRLPGQTLHLVRADSHSPTTLELTESYLEGHRADFLFIDADHTESGVRSDYQMYSKLVRKGGMIALHDIAIKEPGYGVHKLWAELKATNETQDILGKPEAFGIGMLYV